MDDEEGGWEMIVESERASWKVGYCRAMKLNG